MADEMVFSNDRNLSRCWQKMVSLGNFFNSHRALWWLGETFKADVCVIGEELEMKETSDVEMLDVSTEQQQQQQQQQSVEHEYAQEQGQRQRSDEGAEDSSKPKPAPFKLMKRERDSVVTLSSAPAPALAVPVAPVPAPAAVRAGWNKKPTARSLVMEQVSSMLQSLRPRAFYVITFVNLSFIYFQN